MSATDRMSVGAALDAVRPLAPERLAGSWDRVGLQVGDASAAVSAAMLCIDLTDAVIDEAAAAGCGLVIAYHPPVFAPLRGVRADAGWSERRVHRCAAGGMAVYSPHTALDAVSGGVCDWLAGVCGAGDSRPLEPAGSAARFTLTAFAPEADADAVLAAVWAAGAGRQGRYDRCAFSSAGTGGFRPLAGAEPAVGVVGERTEVPERRLELVVSGDRVDAVAAALRAAHPYEEPAFGFTALAPVGLSDEGAGRLRVLDAPVPAAELAGRVRDALGVPVKLGGAGDRSIRTVAVCPGSGGKMFEPVEADAYLTGEMQHHQALDLVQRGKTVLLGGHTATERPYLPVYRERILGTAAGVLDWRISRSDAAPLRIV